MISIPFSGNKRYSYKQVKEIVQDGGYEAVYEPFGGSCVLSVNLFKDHIVTKAVVNDYDRFFNLYPEYLDLKDKVVEEGYKRGLRRIVRNHSKNYRVNEDGSRTELPTRVLQGKDRLILQDIISEFVPEKFWRYFTLGGNFTYSAVSSCNKIKLTDFTQFGSYLKTDKQREYLEVFEQLEVDNLDWLDFLNKHEASIRGSRSILILDPPYIGAAQGQYEGQFTEEETIKLINKALDLGCDFIFFNHDKDKVEAWLDGLNVKIQYTGCSNNTANHNRKDVMAYVVR